MLRLIRYLKPYTFSILLVIALLFVQANADLALPDYMSRIVNVGIQQNGIENALPLAVRQSQMNKIVVFLAADQKNAVLSHYTLIDENNDSHPLQVEQFSIITNEPVYILDGISQAEITSLNSIMARAIVTVAGIDQVLKDPQRTAAMTELLGNDATSISKEMDIYTILSSLPEMKKSQLTGMISSRLDGMDDNTLIKAAVLPIMDEYRALGLNVENIASRYTWRMGTIMLLITLLSGTCTILVSYLSARSAAGLARDLRRSVFQRVETFSAEEFDKFSTASLITRSTNDVTQIQMVVIMMLRMVFYAPIIGVGGVIRAVAKSTGMWWIIALAVIVLLGLILTVFSIALPKFKLVQSLIDRLNLITRENLSGMMVIRAFNMQDHEEGRFDRANQDLTKNSLFINRVMVIMMPFMMLIMNGLTLLIIWVGARQVAEASLQVGDMMAFMQYAIQIVMSFLMLAMMFIILPRAAVSGDRIAEVLETKPRIKDPVEPRHFDDTFTGTIEFQEVTFRYPGAEEDVLRDITFSALPGQTTAIVGTTGSGKSTIVNLIPRFYDVTTGAIIISGIDIRDVTQYELREKIGYIPQKGDLFSGTIESNLKFGRPEANEEELRSAAGISQAAEFIFSKPEGLNAEISQGGKNVSGGQRQRLSIARALIKKAPIYIFDDSFSALDFKTESALRKSIKEFTGSSTVLIVTQRIATIKNADQIIVLDDGHIVGKGTHQSLMESCEVYRGIAMSQLNQEELA